MRNREKFLNKWLTDHLPQPYTYNSTTLAHELTKLQIVKSNRIITFDIKDLYVNIPIEEITNITKTQLTHRKIDDTKITQTCLLLGMIMKQNYLQFDQRFYQPNKEIAMGSPISGLIAEIFLQHYEQHLRKNSLDSKTITFYNRYVDDIIIIHSFILQSVLRQVRSLFILHSVLRQVRSLFILKSVLRQVRSLFNLE
jgi:hypothetical protein